MIKFRLYYDKDKEEKFLNDMSAKGYAMTSFFCGFYNFMKCKPNEYTYRVDLVRDKSPEELADYISLIEESGAEFVQRWFVWAFFRKKGEFKLYSDSESQISLYKKIRTTFIIFTTVELLALPSIIINIYLDSELRVFFIIMSFVIAAIIAAFVRQIYNCNKKIKSIKN